MEQGIVPTLNYGAGNGSGEGWGGSGIWAIVLIACLFGRGGWGGNGGGDCGGGNTVRDAVDNAELNARFNSLETQIGNVNDLAQLRDNYKESCDTNMNVTMQGSNVLAAVAEAKFDNALIAKDAQLAAQQCCCETNRNIDQVRFENSQNTCEITNAIHAEGEATRQLITADKIESLRDKLAEERLRASQCAQNAELIAALRPTPIPAYQACNPYAALNGCGCGTGLL